MKAIHAYIKRHKLSAVTLALRKLDALTGVTVIDTRGFGRGRARNEPHRIVEDLVDYVPGVKLEIVCSDDLVEDVIRIIQEKAHTGLRGDGKIYIYPVEDAIRISTGERGPSAI
jgi:nitrogen regulatory protein PII